MPGRQEKERDDTQKRFAVQRAALALVFLSALALAGCGGGGGGSAAPPSGGGSGSGSVLQGVVWPKTAAQTRPGAGRLSAHLVSDALSVVIQLSDSGGHAVGQAQTVTRPAGGGAATTTFPHLAPGTLNLTATAYAAPNGTGAVLGAATTTVPVAANVTEVPPALSVSGQITALSLLPALPVAVGKSLALLPAATNPAGIALIAPGQLAWASDTPAVATVDANGVVTGVSPGTAVVKAADSVSGLSGSTTVSVTPAVATGGYAATALGTLGGTLSSASGINDAGQVVGDASLPGSPVVLHAFLDSGGVLADLTPSLAGTVSQAFALNAAGQVAGEFEAGGATTHAFLDSGGTLTDLNPFLGASASVANGVNGKGQVVGSFTSGGVPQAFLYDSASAGSGGMGQVIPLQPQLYGLMATSSVANGINDAGQIVGRFTPSGGTSSHAFLLSPTGGAADLNPLLGGASGSDASAVNAGGMVVGTFTAGGEGHAFAYNSAAGAVTDLNPLLGASSSSARAVNAGGRIVGSFVTSSGAKHAFTYDSGTGVVTDLNPFLGGVSSEATGVNDAGVICATSVGSDGQSRAYVLSPG